MEMKQNELVKQELHDEEFNFEDFDFDSMEDLLNQDIEELSIDLNKLGEEKELISNPDSLGKEIYNSIFNQLGAQSGLDLSSDTLIKQYRKNHKDETSQSAGVDALRDKKYVNVQKANTAASKTNDGVKDAYTGKIVKTSDGHQINTDHVVSRKEIYGNGFKKRLRELSGNEVKDLANLDENLVATNESLNKSKGDKSVKEYTKAQEQRKKDLINQNQKANEKIKNDPKLSEQEKEAKIRKNNMRLKDKLDADAEKMKVVDKKARKAINKKIAVDATKNVAKEAGTAALRSMLISSAVTLIKSIIDSLVEFWKSANKSWTLFKEKMKQAVSNFFHSLKSVIGNAMSGGIGSIVNNIVSLFGEKVGKIWGILKTGISTIKSAYKILTDKDTPFSIRLAEFGKAITVGLAVASTAFLSESINTALIAVFPALKMMTLPIIGSVSGFIVEMLLGILNGLIAGIVIHQLNKFIANKQNSELSAKTIEKQNEIVQKQKVQIALAEKKLDYTKEKAFDEIDARHRAANDITREILDEIFTPVAKTGYDLDEMQADLESLL
ncbi:hypothetical protein [Streptococcus anginosus]|uniref:hypothetical protein n=1 Tax=Streptococcus anginosus TaxID=1328 RepID=UPI00398CFE1C